MNENFSIYLVLFAIGYIFGSFPSGVLISKLFFGFDIRTQGSGNMGSTNVIRVLGKKWGFIVQLMDLLKGYIPVIILPFILQNFYGNNFLNILSPNKLIFYKLFIGTSAVIGHIFSFYVSFKGGKGINTSVGMMLAIAPIDIGITILCFVILLLIFGMVSLGSILGAIILPISILVRQFVFNHNIQGFDVLLTFSIFLALLIIFTHRTNIIRIFNGQESKFEKIMIKNIIIKNQLKNPN